MKRNIREIYYAFGGKLVGTKLMKRYVCEVLGLMEEDVINFVTSKCWFFASMDDAFAFTLTGNDLKDYHLIFLSDELFVEPLSQIYYTIAHEIGHVMLGHRNSILERQSKKEIREQENQADAFARKFVFDR